MAGLSLDTGVTGSVVGQLYNYGGGLGAAGAPPRSSVPEGPATVAQAAYGRGAAGGGGSNAGMLGTIIGAAAVVVLFCMWAALPR
jgi:hypothetical protein